MFVWCIFKNSRAASGCQELQGTVQKLFRVQLWKNIIFESDYSLADAQTCKLLTEYKCLIWQILFLFTLNQCLTLSSAQAIA